MTAEQIGNVSRDDVKNSATTTAAKPVADGGARLLSGDYGSSWPDADDTTRHVDTTVAKAVGEARPLGIAEHSVATALVPRERVQQRTAEQSEDAPQFRKETVEVTKSCLETRLPGIAKQRATTESDIAVPVGEPGLSWPKDKWTPRAATAAAIEPAGEARPPGITKHCAMTEPESCNEVGHSQRVLMKLGRLCWAFSVRGARTAPSLPQTQCLLTAAA